jgi:hypothetical protein
MILGMIGCIVMAASTQNQLRYGFAHVCMSGVFAGGPLIAVWLAGNTPWKGTRSVILGVNGWSNLAGVIAGQIFKSRYAPRCKFPRQTSHTEMGMLTIHRRSAADHYHCHHGRRRSWLGLYPIHVSVGE